MASVKERARTGTILPRLGVGKEADRGQEAACEQYFEEKRDHQADVETFFKSSA